VIEDDVFALLHIAKGDESLRILDAVPCGLTVAQQVVEGVVIGFCLE